MDQYDQYIEACKPIRRANERLLQEFEARLKADGLSKKTIDNHIDNMAFYLNEFLLYEDAIEAQDGIHAVSEFLGYWFIRKALWANQTSLKSNATSLKKFYGCLCEKGMVGQQDLIDLKVTLKQGMPEWLATLDRYDDPDVTQVW